MTTRRCWAQWLWAAILTCGCGDHVVSDGQDPDAGVGQAGADATQRPNGQAGGGQCDLVQAPAVGPRETPSTDPVPGATSFALSSGYGCSVHEDGRVRCWGRVPPTSEGPGLDFEISPVPQVVEGISDAVAVAAAEGFACALTTSGQVMCWGSQLSTGIAAPALVPDLSDIVEIRGGGYVMCALRAAGTVRCWGDSQGYQMFSDSALMGRPDEPYEVPGVTTAVALSVGSEFACAILADTTAACWGSVQSTDGSGRFVPFPQTQMLLDQTGQPVTGVLEIVSSPEYPSTERQACFSTASGDLQCTFDGVFPLPIAELSGAQHLALAGPTLCATTASEGSVRCRGRRAVVLGLEGDYLGDAVTVDIPALMGVQELHMAETFACARQADGIWCWGDNSVGQVGINAPLGVTSQASSVPGLDDARSVAVGLGTFGGPNRSCIVSKADELWCWDDTTAPSLLLTQVAGVVSGDDHACAWMNDGTVRCWGDPVDPDLAVVDGLTHIVQVTAVFGSTCALDDEGSVWCWSSGFATDMPQAPTRVEGISGAIDVAMASDFLDPVVCVIEEAGTVVCSEAVPQSDGTTGHVYQPVVDLEHAVQLALSTQMRCARLEDGSVQCWNYADEAGRFVTAPTAAAGLTDVTDIAARGSVLCAVVGDCGVACFPSPLTLNAPATLVPATAGATDVATAGARTCAVTGTGVSCWGQRPLGDNIQPRTLSPVHLAY